VSDPKELSDNDINRWLSTISSSLKIPESQVSETHWQLGMKNSVGKYNIDIIDQGEWITYGVPLVADVEGKNRVTFYKTILDLNARLNGVHLGIEDNRLILVREEQKEGLNAYSLGRSIAIIDSAHQVVFPFILDEIKKLGLDITSR
jgi:hypothetical protein